MVPITVSFLLLDEFVNELTFTFHSDLVGTSPGYFATYDVYFINETLLEDSSGEYPEEGTEIAFSIRS